MRSMLFVPGDSARKFARARTGAADALILDLEDSIAASGKVAARGTVREMLAGDRGLQSIYVRVNALDTGTALADLAAVMPGRPDGIVLPKSEGVADVRLVAAWLDAFEAAHGLAAGATGIVAIATESARSLFRLADYDHAGPRLRGLMWGAEDLSASLGASSSRSGRDFHSPFTMARNLCLAAAATANVVAIDTVYVDVDDIEGLEQEARDACRDGFGAKAVIHPRHVEPVNAAFTPDQAAVGWANRVLALFADPAAGVMTLDGRMIDKPHLRAAQRILSRVRA